MEFGLTITLDKTHPGGWLHWTHFPNVIKDKKTKSAMTQTQNTLLP